MRRLASSGLSLVLLQRATVTVTRVGVASTPSCSCCLDVVAAECVSAVGTTPPDACASTAARATTATAADPSTTAVPADVCIPPTLSSLFLAAATGRFIAKFHYTGPTGPARTFCVPGLRETPLGPCGSPTKSGRVRSGPCSGI